MINCSRQKGSGLLSLLKIGSFYFSACFILENKIWYQKDENSGASEWKLKHVYKHLHRFKSKPPRDQTFFHRLKHPCLYWEHGLCLLTRTNAVQLRVFTRKINHQYKVSLHVFFCPHGWVGCSKKYSVIVGHELAISTSMFPRILEPLHSQVSLILWLPWFPRNLMRTLRSIGFTLSGGSRFNPMYTD